MVYSYASDVPVSHAVTLHDFLSQNETHLLKGEEKSRIYMIPSSSFFVNCYLCLVFLAYPPTLPPNEKSLGRQRDQAGKQVSAIADINHS